MNHRLPTQTVDVMTQKTPLYFGTFTLLQTIENELN